ncbi:P-loop containing nucleoside triphosphate hydrolase protein [Thermothelomyces heterothallicus CBS 202.75]|uniref:P-loop containing nucleoside triphosphate hydrolase protein n=1 Tax=Thermothelomyces heterothallicus CBS 202.75 TaxID=1149848 RepID=UPI0037444523
MVTFASDSLTKLSSKDQLELLDSIDQLRLQGINHYISLPQIIVCGDQSSGKSSVLEAISGIPFPVKSNLCTRFPTELVLRKAPYDSVCVSIVPHESRTEAERKALMAFREELDGFDALPELVDRAKTEMGITTHGRAFSRDILRIEVTGPNSPQLTLVDLPGLIHSETKNQTTSDIQLIKDIVQSYMREPRCIILAVVSAKNDIANQVVLGLARTADPKGTRTLGVITKPDTLVPGGGSEAMYVSLARNQEIEFRHGWHVLKNMDSEKGPSTLVIRDIEEAEFFRSGPWATLPHSCLGIDNLRTRLSRVLLQQISTELPGLIEEIDQKFSYCKDQLERLGRPRASRTEQRLYLIRLSQSFQDLVKASTGGNYDRPFFTHAEDKLGYEQRIRAVVRNLNEEFASEMRLRGHYRQVVDGCKDSSPAPRGVISISRDEFVDHIDMLMRRTRGRELPGTFHPMIVVDLFREQSRPWEAIVRHHVEKVWEAASRFVGLVAAHTADPSTTKALRRFVIDPAMGKIMDEMRAKTTELLNQHKGGHPITYNDEFTEALQKVRDARRNRNDPAEILRQFFNLPSLGGDRLSGYYDLNSLAESLAKFRERDPRRFAANEALDCLNAYYQVAMRRFIDDIAVEVVEEKLMSALEDILSPVSVSEMSADDVARIAGESEETRAERDRLNKQLEVLENGRDTCRRFVDVRFSGDSVFAAVDSSGSLSLVEGPTDDDADSIAKETPEAGYTPLNPDPGAPTDF